MRNFNLQRQEGMKQIYTIGYSAFPKPEEMIDVIRYYSITCLVDVRSSPYSSYYVEFNREPLAARLKKAGILYRNYAREFGARQEDPRYLTPDGYLDFGKFTQSEAFLDGVGKLTGGIDLGYVFVLMCADKDPMECHRGIMIGKALKDLGFEVKHILEGNHLETQEEMELRVVGNQISMFDGDDAIGRFYREQAEKIAYKVQR